MLDLLTGFMAGPAGAGAGGGAPSLSLGLGFSDQTTQTTLVSPTLTAGTGAYTVGSGSSTDTTDVAPSTRQDVSTTARGPDVGVGGPMGSPGIGSARGVGTSGVDLERLAPWAALAAVGVVIARKL